MVTSTTYLTLQEFFALPESDRQLELIDGQAVAKMAPKFFHSHLQKTLLLILSEFGFFSQVSSEANFD